MKESFSKVLVTGGCGFIGSHIVDALIKSGLKVGVIDDLSTGFANNLAHQSSSSSLTIHNGDIRDGDFVRHVMEGYTAVIHQAAMVSVTRSIEDPLLTNSVNVDGTLNLLCAARDAKVRRFVYASSSSVYGETAVQPKVESMPTMPISPYAVSKLAGENYCRVFARVYGMQTVSLRYFNVYGPRQTYGPYSGVIPAFVNRVLNDEPPVIFGDGQQTRDFTYVEDVAAANILALERDVDPGDVFNISAGAQITLNELASSVERLMGKSNLGIEHAPPRKGDIRFSSSDISKARHKLGFSPKVSFEGGLKKVIDWFGSAALPSGTARIG